MFRPPSSGPGAGFGSGLLLEHEPTYRSIVRQIRELIHPQKLPPLKLTSRPVAVKDLWGSDEYRKYSAPVSALIHILVVGLLVVPLTTAVISDLGVDVDMTPVALSPYVPDLPPADSQAGGGGGGGDRSPEAASLGDLPKASMEQLAPPAVVIRNPDPVIPVVPTVIVPPNIPLPQVNMAMLGDPMGQVGLPSSGIGSGGGIGSGRGTGVGSGSGGGIGPGEGGGAGGGVFKVGSGVSAPKLVFKVDPEYSEQARKAKFQGTVVLNLIVQRDGSVRDIKIVQSLGLGLDEKAIEAVAQWRFRPGQKSGAAVDVTALVEVTFRLL